MASQKRLWFALHGWLSLPVWMIFGFVCATGTVATVSHELTWLCNPKARATNLNHLPRKPIPELLSAVEASNPGAEITHVMIFEPYLVTAVGFTSEQKPAAIAYVNPYSGEIQDVVEGITFIGFMRSLHGWMLFPWQHRYSIGYFLVTFMSIVALSALITGLMVYRKFWKSYTTPRLRTRDGARTFYGDFHRLLGAWSIWFVLIISGTGMWYLLQSVLWYQAVDLFEEPYEPSVSDAPADRTAKLGIKDVLKVALAERQFLKPSWISAPEHNADTWKISAKSGDFFLYDEFSTQAHVDPWSGNIRHVTDPGSMGFFQKLSHLADPLHYGKFGGLTTKLVWFVFGIGLTTMSLSGFAIRIKRMRTSREALPSPRYFLINGIVILAPVWFIFRSFYPGQQPSAIGERIVDDVRIEAFPADESAPYADANGYLKDFSFKISEHGQERFRVAHAAIGRQFPTLDQRLSGILHGHGSLLHAHVPAPQTIEAEDELWLVVERWGGEKVVVRWGLPDPE